LPIIFVVTISLLYCMPVSAQSRLTDTAYGKTTRELRSNKIPDSVFQMLHLKYLGISGEDCDRRLIDSNGKDVTQCWMINEIPPEIKNLKNLSTIRITLNTIRMLPPEIGELQNLKLIDLTDGGLSNVDAVTQIAGLEYLYLYGCNIQKLPAEIGKLTHLKELGLVGNHIDEAEQKRIKLALPNCRITF
jgi:hypothetical protein